MRSHPHAPSRSRPRRGFALLAVLWVVTGIATLAFAAAFVARQSVSTATNRRDFARAYWHAEGCAERAHAAVEAALAGASSDALGLAWTRLGHTFAASVSGPGCEARLVPVGTRLDMEVIDRVMLIAVLQARGVRYAQADSLADAFLDWRDGDREARESGAERAWYLGAGQHTPRNGPIADVLEVRRIRGFENIAWVDSLLSAERGRVSLNHAPREVLSAVPGLAPEVVTYVLERRAQGETIVDLPSLAGRLSRVSQDALATRAEELARAVTAEPDAWLLVSVGAPAGRQGAGGPRASGVGATLELKLVRSGARAAVVRKRWSWS